MDKPRDTPPTVEAVLVSFACPTDLKAAAAIAAKAADMSLSQFIRRAMRKQLRTPRKA